MNNEMQNFSSSPSEELAQRLLDEFRVNGGPAPASVLNWVISMDHWDHIGGDLRSVINDVVLKLIPASKFLRSESFSHGNQQHVIALFNVKGREFALIPGGEITLGFDEESLSLTTKQQEEWKSCRESIGQPHVIENIVAEVVGKPRRESSPVIQDFKAYLKAVMTPLRIVRLAPFLIELEATQFWEDIEGWSCEDHHAALSEFLARDGFRLPTSDEWEHACAAGSRTVFTWGNDWPEKSSALPRNGFGLKIRGIDEFCSDISISRGFDGGQSMCAGAGNLIETIPLATSFFQVIPEQCRAEWFENGAVRRTLSLA